MAAPQVLALIGMLVAVPSVERVDFGRTVARRLRLLRHADAAVRSRAAQLLGHAPADEALAGLVVALFDASPGVRRAAAGSLSRLADERAAPFLARLVATERSPRVLRAALIGLARCGKSYVGRRILPFLEHPAREVRVAAAAALGHVGDAGQRDALWAALRYAPDDPDFEVRSAILSAFVNLGWTDDVRRAIGELEASGAKRHWVSRAALITAAGAAGLKERIGEVRHALDRDGDPRVVAAAAGALARLGGRDEVAARLDHSSPLVRRAALVALQECNDPRAVERAAVMVRNDPVRAVRFEAALVLCRAGVPAADAYLVDALRSREPLFWITALAALEERHGRSFGRDPEAWAAFLRERSGP